MLEVKESLYAVPKSRVDEAMTKLAGIQKLNNKELAQIRGILYCDTFMAERDITIREPYEPIPFG